MKLLKNVSPIMIIVLFIIGLVQTAGAMDHSKENMSDQALTASVKAKLSDNPALAGQGIKVAVEDGMVTLTGSVATSEAKESAGQIAESIEGVKAVSNLIEVMPPLIN